MQSDVCLHLYIFVCDTQHEERSNKNDIKREINEKATKQAGRQTYKNNSTTKLISHNM